LRGSACSHASDNPFGRFLVFRTRELITKLFKDDKQKRTNQNKTEQNKAHLIEELMANLLERATKLFWSGLLRDDAIALGSVVLELGLMEYQAVQQSFLFQVCKKGLEMWVALLAIVRRGLVDYADVIDNIANRKNGRFQ
jgi:hypothetical protein